MSAFGRRQGMGSGTPGRPAFGVARPMQGGGPAPRPADDGGQQFPPLDSLPLPALPGEAEGVSPGTSPGMAMDAMQRLTDRQNASGDAGCPDAGCQEACGPCSNAGATGLEDCDTLDAGID